MTQGYRAAFSRLVTAGSHPNPTACYWKFRTQMYLPNFHQTLEQATKIGRFDLEKRLRRLGRSLANFGEDISKEDYNSYPSLARHDGTIDFEAIRAEGEEMTKILNPGQLNVIEKIETALSNRG
ncbi:hypothetical protein L596_025997 [Steinernema carpocapsae]|uniref:Uncharacterized protein n=1 Tax=Steinernema carpocapsae TaxID=34508 RepID=A0A4U5M061_STECR|nr:hypothetical protein L596_025997 [Steinernema carpocapsae]